jgi:hypothetical protein
MPALPIQVNAIAAAGGEWDTTYALENDDGTVMNITGKSFEFVIRPTVTDATEPALVSVSSVSASAQGFMTVNVAAGTVLVVLNPAATSLLGQGARPYTLWMDPGLTDATPLVAGTFFSNLVAVA